MEDSRSRNLTLGVKSCVDLDFEVDYPRLLHLNLILILKKNTRMKAEFTFLCISL